MRIVVLGAGALGSLIGGMLASKNEVVLIGREPQVAAIERNGLKIVGATRAVVFPDAATSASGLKAPDLLLVTVKAYDTATALGNARALVGPRTTVLSLQNGITTLDVLKKCAPSGRVIGGWTSHGATMEKPGLVKHAGLGDTVVGEPDGSGSKRARVIAKALSESDIRTTLSCDIRREIWLKGIVNSAINPLTAIFRCENGEIASNSALSRTAKLVCGEGAAVARASGFKIGAAEAFRRTMNVAVQTANNRSSMLRDVELGRRTEIDYLNGAIAELGAKRDISVPVNDALVSTIRALSKAFSAPEIR